MNVEFIFIRLKCVAGGCYEFERLKTISFGHQKRNKINNLSIFNKIVFWILLSSFFTNVSDAKCLFLPPTLGIETAKTSRLVLGKDVKKFSPAHVLFIYLF